MNEETDFEDSAPWFVFFITLAGGFLRVLLLGVKGMWLDETFSVWMASHSVRDMFQWLVRIDQHPPLYYLLLHYWIALNGDTPYYVRLLSAVLGTATIPIIYLIGKRLCGAVVGLMAALFLALSVFNIYFAQETRMYTLLTFNVAIAIYALVRLLTDSSSARPIGSGVWGYLRGGGKTEPVETRNLEETNPKDEVHSQGGWRAWLFRGREMPFRAIETDLAWVAFIVFSVATLLSHNTAVLFILATNIFVVGLILLQRIKKPDSSAPLWAPSLGNWVIAQIGIFLLWSPWLASFIKQASGVYERFWIPEPTWDAVTQALKTFLNPVAASVPANEAIVIWILYGVVLCLGVVYFRKRISQFLFLAGLFVIPFLGELIVSLWRPIFFPRTLIWTTMPLYLVLAAGVAQFRFRVLSILVLGSLATLNVFSAGDYFRFYEKEDWSTPAGYVAKYAERDDLVLFNSNFVVIPFNYYFKPFEIQYSLQVKEQGVPQDLFESGIPEPEMTANDVPQLVSLLQGHDRVWLVYSHDSYTDPNGLIPATLAEQMKLIQTRDFYGGKVELYGTR